MKEVLKHSSALCDIETRFSEELH